MQASSRHRQAGTVRRDRRWGYARAGCLLAILPAILVTFPPITDRKLIVMCAIGKRSAAAQKQLAASGIPNLYNLAGGIDAWKKAGYETQGGKYEALDFSI